MIMEKFVLKSFLERWNVMNKTIEAVFDGTVFLPDTIVKLEPNTRVEITIRTKVVEAEKPKSFLRVARSLNLEGPKDFSENIDEYLYGGKELDGK